jgi:DNA-binding response OmpR family regulator
VSDEAAAPAGAILLVEDQEPVRGLLRALLSRAGYVVLEAPDSAEALRLSAAHLGTIHLLLTDLNLPGASGCLLAGQLRAARPGLRVLYISGNTEAHLSGPDAGAAFLKKPFTAPQLLAAVAAAIGSEP